MAKELAGVYLPSKLDPQFLPHNGLLFTLDDDGEFEATLVYSREQVETLFARCTDNARLAFGRFYLELCPLPEVSDRSPIVFGKPLSHILSQFIKLSQQSDRNEQLPIEPGLLTAYVCKTEIKSALCPVLFQDWHGEVHIVHSLEQFNQLAHRHPELIGERERLAYEAQMRQNGLPEASQILAIRIDGSSALKLYCGMAIHRRQSTLN